MKQKTKLELTLCADGAKLDIQKFALKLGPDGSRHTGAHENAILVQAR